MSATLETYCVSCHGANLAQGTDVHLVTRDDLLAQSTVNRSLNVAQRSLSRMQSSVVPMPPSPAPAVPADAIAAFAAWVDAGYPQGDCSVNAGQPVFDGGLADLPCDVAAFVGAKCDACHRSPPTGGAPFPLLSLADFTAPSSIDPATTVAQRAAIRISSTSNPMPPAGSPAATAQEISTFQSWVNAGTPKGSCGLADAGGPVPTTCLSGNYWTYGNEGSSDMNPGMACKACHAVSEPFRNYQFMGTVFTSQHEKDTCEAALPTGVVVDIVDANGTVLSLPARSLSGNFYSGRTTGLAMPFTARITFGGRTATMTTPQTDGDCNGCHTEQGANGAPGRITLP